MPTIRINGSGNYQRVNEKIDTTNYNARRAGTPDYNENEYSIVDEINNATKGTPYETDYTYEGQATSTPIAHKPVRVNTVKQTTPTRTQYKNTTSYTTHSYDDQDNQITGVPIDENWYEPQELEQPANTRKKQKQAKLDKQFEDIQNNGNNTEKAQLPTWQTRLFSAMAYSGPLILVPAIIARKDPRVKFHLNQAGGILIIFILLQVFSFAIAQANTILTASLENMTLTLSLSIANTVLEILFLIVGVIDLVGLILAALGKQKKLPLAGKLRFFK
jgi:hypothetical protein